MLTVQCTCFMYLFNVHPLGTCEMYMLQILVQSTNLRYLYNIHNSGTCTMYTFQIFVQCTRSMYLCRLYLIVQAHSWEVTSSELTSPSSLDLPVSSLRLPTREGTLGAWLLLPNQPFDTIVVYMHGVSGTRAAPLRLPTYRALLQTGWAVLAFDYRCRQAGDG